MTADTSHPTGVGPSSPLLRQPTRRYFKMFVQRRGESVPSAGGPILRLAAKVFFANFIQPVQRINAARRPCRSRRETVQDALSTFTWE